MDVSEVQGLQSVYNLFKMDLFEKILQINNLHWTRFGFIYGLKSLLCCCCRRHHRRGRCHRRRRCRRRRHPRRRRRRRRRCRRHPRRCRVSRQRR